METRSVQEHDTLVTSRSMEELVKNIWHQLQLDLEVKQRIMRMMEEEDKEERLILEAQKKEERMEKQRLVKQEWRDGQIQRQFKEITVCLENLLIMDDDNPDLVD